MLRMRKSRVVGAAVATAAVVRTAGAVSHHQQQKYAQQDAVAQQAQYVEEAPPAAPEPQVEYVQAPPAQAPAPAPAPAAAAGPDMMTQLQQMAQLHDAGALTNEEFAAAKAKILAA